MTTEQDASRSSGPASHPTIEIVAHCWNYDRLATLFLSQFILHPPSTPTTVTICYSADDQRTVDVLHFFWWERKTRVPRLPDGLTFNWYEMPTPKLLRRAIGRNERALATKADFVLFADIDYLLGPWAVDAIVGQMAEACRSPIPGDDNPVPKLCFPRTAGWTSHEDGDAMIEAAGGGSPRVVGVNPASFVETRMPRPIGGTQWVTGDTARRFGYLNGVARWQRPARNWRRTYEDTSYRKFLARAGIPQYPIVVPNVWRVRHSKRGRFDVGVRL